MSKFALRASLSIAAIIASGFLAAKSYAEEIIIIKEQPPVPKVEIVEKAPREGDFWLPGHWKREGNDWVWVQGKWEKPPHPNAVWEAGYWAWRPYGWVWRPGHWVW